MPHIGGGAVAVVGQRLYNNRHTGGAVALIGQRLIVVAAAGAQGFFDGALDVVVGHIGRLGLGNDGSQTGIVFGIAASALFDCHNHLLGNLGKGGRALGVRRAFGLLNIMPLGMSGHGSSS